MFRRLVGSVLLTALSVSCASPSARVQPTRLALSPDVQRVVDSARQQTQVTTSYDPSYVKIAYPGGDVPAQTGACTDVVIRAFRAAGVDLQREVHDDMRRTFSAYPQKWGLKGPDTNIDHRRVPNLMVFFRRSGKAVDVTEDPSDYAPGDVVAWDLGGGVTHIGVVADEVDASTGRPGMVHNIGSGARIEDVLFAWQVIGHYRYFQ